MKRLGKRNVRLRPDSGVKKRKEIMGHEIKTTAIISALTILCLISLSACQTTQEQRSVTQREDPLSHLERGKTTVEDVAASFGSPQKEIMGKENNRIWVYQENSNHGMIKGGHNAILALWFDKDGILTEFMCNELENTDKKKFAIINVRNLRE